MSQYPGGPPPPPQDPYAGQQPPADPYAPPPPSDPYFGPPPSDPYAPPQDPYYGQPPQDPSYGQPPQDPYAQQQAWQAWQAQQPPPQPPVPPREAPRRRGGSGAAVFGIILVIVGVWVLFGDQLDVDLDLREVWPIGAVILGAVMVVASLIPRGEEDRR